LPGVAFPLTRPRAARNAGTGSLDGGGRATPPPHGDRDGTAAAATVERIPGLPLQQPACITHLPCRDVDCGDADCISPEVEDLNNVKAQVNAA